MILFGYCDEPYHIIDILSYVHGDLGKVLHPRLKFWLNILQLEQKVRP